MERASIDELFIDVTAFCYKSSPHHKSGSDDDVDDTNIRLAKIRSACDGDNATQLPEETIVCHQECVTFHETNSDIGRALCRGCYIALSVRNAVLDTLGFTLSAGISTNKLVAKLAASYGKPNGQVRAQYLSSTSFTFVVNACFFPVNLIACYLLCNLLQKPPPFCDAGSDFSLCNAKCNGRDSATKGPDAGR